MGEEKRGIMADFNVTGNSPNFVIQPGSRKFPTNTTSISFQSASQACTINFTPTTGNCFGVASINVPGTGRPLYQAVTDASTIVTTKGTAVAQVVAAAARVGGGPADSSTGDGTDTLQITFGDSK
jgi:hypothetical protein